jgi:putative membrane protein
MKIKFRIVSQLGIVVLGLGSFCLANTASALQSQYPPLRTGANNDISPAPAPAKGAKAAAPAALSEKDKAFMKNAAKGGMEEVEMGRMAEQQGQSTDVKNFGKRMVTDHTMANNELMQLAAGKKFSLPKEKAKVEKFKAASFDKEYMADMVKDHQKDLAEFQSEAKTGSDPDLKAWAAKTSEMIKKHLALAQQTQSKLK